MKPIVEMTDNEFEEFIDNYLLHPEDFSEEEKEFIEAQQSAEFFEHFNRPSVSS